MYHFLPSEENWEILREGVGLGVNFRLHFTFHRGILYMLVLFRTFKLVLTLGSRITWFLILTHFYMGPKERYAHKKEIKTNEYYSSKLLTSNHKRNSKELDWTMRRSLCVWLTLFAIYARLSVGIVAQFHDIFYTIEDGAVDSIFQTSWQFSFYQGGILLAQAAYPEHLFFGWPREVQVHLPFLYLEECIWLSKCQVVCMW